LIISNLKQIQHMMQVTPEHWSYVLWKSEY